MAIPLIPFIAGAALGGLATYFYQDKTLRRNVNQSSKKLGEGLKKTASTVTEQAQKSGTAVKKKVKHASSYFSASSSAQENNATDTECTTDKTEDA